MIRIAGVAGALAVLAGAFGAHALKSRLPPELLASWQTAAHYHLVHSAVLLALALGAERHPSLRRSFLLIACGTAVFSGSLYALALTGWRLLGALTPLGGVLLVAGWGAAAWGLSARRTGPSGSGG